MPGLRLSCQFVNITDGLYKGNSVSIESKLNIWYLISIIVVITKYFF